MARRIAKVSEEGIVTQEAHTTVGQEIEPAPHRWKASAFTTATNPAPLNDHKNIMVRMLKY